MTLLLIAIFVFFPKIQIRWQDLRVCATGAERRPVRLLFLFPRRYNMPATELPAADIRMLPGKHTGLLLPAVRVSRGPGYVRQRDHDHNHYHDHGAAAFLRQRLPGGGQTNRLPDPRTRVQSGRRRGDRVRPLSRVHVSIWVIPTIT